MSREAELEKEGISLLGNQNVKYPDQYAPEILETFLNKHPVSLQISLQYSSSPITSPLFHKNPGSLPPM